MFVFARLFVVVLVVCFAGVALAQTPSPPVTRLRGTISAVDAKTLTIATRDGQTVKVTMSDGVRLSAVQSLDLAAIKPGCFIGTAAVPGPGNAWQALEVVVFPEEMRGTGEGHYDWDLAPGSTMTNGTVDGVVQAKNSRELQVSYKGGRIEIMVPLSAPIVTFAPADRSDLKPGVPVYTPATEAADGSLSTSRVVIGKNGVKPPM